MDAINLQQKLALFADYWNPRIIAELNGQQVKLAKLKGEFVMHRHSEEDELFLVLRGTMEMHFTDRIEIVNEGECIIVPRGVDHMPVAREEVHLLLFEPATTVNTGDVDDARTRRTLDHI